MGTKITAILLLMKDFFLNLMRGLACAKELFAAIVSKAAQVQTGSRGVWRTGLEVHRASHSSSRDRDLELQLQHSRGRTGVSRGCHSPSAVSQKGEEDARPARQS